MGFFIDSAIHRNRSQRRRTDQCSWNVAFCQKPSFAYPLRNDLSWVGSCHEPTSDRGIVPPFPNGVLNDRLYPKRTPKWWGHEWRLVDARWTKPETGKLTPLRLPAPVKEFLYFRYCCSLAGRTPRLHQALPLFTSCTTPLQGWGGTLLRFRPCPPAFPCSRAAH